MVYICMRKIVVIDESRKIRATRVTATESKYIYLTYLPVELRMHLGIVKGTKLKWLVGYDEDGRRCGLVYVEEGGDEI